MCGCGLLSKPQAAAEAQRCRGAAGTLTLCKTLLHLCLCSGGTVADSQVITQHWVQQREGATPHTSVQKHLFTWSTHHTVPPAHSHSPAHRPHPNTRSTLCQGELEGLGPERVQTVPLARVCLNLLWGEECPQFKQVCAYADALQQHVLCIRAKAKSDSRRSSAQD